MFQCKNEAECIYDKNTGYILQNTMTTCQADAKWENQDDIECVEVNYDVTIERSVGEGDTWALGYYGNFYTGTVSTALINRLGWNLDNKVIEFSVVVSQGVLSCVQIDEQNDASFTVTCDENENGSFNSYLSLTSRLTELTSHSITFFAHKYETCGYNSRQYYFHLQSKYMYTFLVMCFIE